MRRVTLYLALLVASVAISASPTTLFVDPGSTNSTAPFSDWNTAATNIQDAIDAAVAGDLVLVTNGTYSTGGRVVHPNAFRHMTNRVVLDKALTVQSVNGPEATVIVGNSPLGDNGTRCAYLTNGAALIGFTLTNGATQTSFIGQLATDRSRLCSGGAVWCEDTSALISNCVLVANTAEYGYGGMGGGAYQGTLQNCSLLLNQAVLGGGAYGSILIDCLLSNNTSLASSLLNEGTSVASSGGGAHSCSLTNCLLYGNYADKSGGAASSTTLHDCLVIANSAAIHGGGLFGCSAFDTEISKNSARIHGGGSYAGSLSNCTLTANTAAFGGGNTSGTLNNCLLSDNLALVDGGGAHLATLTSCALVENSALANGGGASGGVLNNCTVAGNTALSGGGTASSALSNCIVYYNTAATGTNYSGGTLDYCCTIPLPGIGVGNISGEPQLADRFHLSINSPCTGAGNPIGAAGRDIDGESWGNPPSIGCDEFYYPGAFIGPLTVAIRSDFANAKSGFPLRFTAEISGHAWACMWTFGDGTVFVNRPYISHAFIGGSSNRVVTLTAYNDDNTNGVSTSVTYHVAAQPVQYVSQSSTNPVAPFMSWATAATNIQDAVDAAFGGGTTIWVSNGVYQTGGRVVTGVLSNRVAITAPMKVQSVNGPSVTVIQGYQVPGSINGDNAVRCVYLADGAQLIGFTLTNGATRGGLNSLTAVELAGGGLYCSSTNGFVSNCIIVSNASQRLGGGAFAGTLDGCVISQNRVLINTSLGALGGSGAAFSRLLNSTIEGNRTMPTMGASALSCVLSNCILRGNMDIGASACTLNDCLITANIGPGLKGGTADSCVISSNRTGADSSVLSNCFLYGNTATNGGGAVNCTLNSCILSNNIATSAGGGAYWNTTPQGQNNTLVGNSAAVGGGLYISASGTLINWTLNNNSASGDGGAIYSAAGAQTFLNCEISGNSSGGNGGGVFAAAAGPLTTVTCSNCTFIGNTAVINGGGANNVSLKQCLLDENRAGNGGGAYGTKAVSNSTFTNNVALTNGGGLNYGSTAVLSNCAFHGNAAANGGGLYLMSGNVSNCFFIGNSATNNGGGVGTASGSIIVRCSLLGNHATVGGGGHGASYIDCLVSGNIATNNGGGVFAAAPGSSNCMILGNSARNNGGGVHSGNWTFSSILANTAANGGGSFSSTLTCSTVSDNHAHTNGGGVNAGFTTGCLVTGNAASYGGGAYNSPLNSCTLVGNFATNAGGGLYLSTAANSILYYNSAPSGSNFSATGSFTFCCAFPQPPGPAGSITNAPAFVDFANANFRLQTNSPCINIGGTLPGTMDIDRRPRVVGGRIDIGAYEFQGPGMGEFIAWLKQNNLPANGPADYADTDADGLNNWAEWIAGTVPTDAESVLKLLTPSHDISGTALTWQSVDGKVYFLQRSTDLLAQPPFSSLSSNLVGQTGTMTYVDNTATNDVPYFYRIGVQ